MSLPQLRLCLEASKRRDAERGLMMLDTVHSAIAPLIAGGEGSHSYEGCLSRLRDVLFPPPPTAPKSARSGWWGQLVALAIPRSAVKLSPAEESFIKSARSALGRA